MFVKMGDEKQTTNEPTVVISTSEESKMFVKMGDEKQTTNEPTVVISTSEPVGGSLKSRLTKKHVMIGVISLLITGLVVVAVLVSIRMITDNNMAIAKYSMNANGVQQNVSTTENSVIYHVTKNDVEAWIVQDFDRGLQVSKVLLDGKATCYVSALNRSEATDPSSIPTTAPDTKNAEAKSTTYKVAPDAIPNISFLGKKASTMCANIPTYHAVPDCGNAADHSIAKSDNSSSVDQRQKRWPALCGVDSWSYQCVCGCCWRICGLFSSYTYVCRYSGGVWYCTYYMYYVSTRTYLGYSGCSYGGMYYLP